MSPSLFSKVCTRRRGSTCYPSLHPQHLEGPCPTPSTQQYPRQTSAREPSCLAKIKTQPVALTQRELLSFRTGRRVSEHRAQHHFQSPSPCLNLRFIRVELKVRAEWVIPHGLQVNILISIQTAGIALFYVWHVK